MSKAKKTTRRPKGDGSCYERRWKTKKGVVRTAWACQITVIERGHPVRKTFAARTQAEALAKRDAYRARPDERTPRDQRSVASFLEQWLGVKASECAVSTVHAYRWAITHYIAPIIGARNLGDVDALDVHELLDVLRKRNCSTRTMRAVYVTLRAAFNYAAQQRFIASNPMSGSKAPKHRAKKIAPWTREQARRFLKCAKDDRLYALYALALACGLRQGELFALKWADVDFNSGRLAVRRQVSEQGGGRAVLQDHTKTGRDRSVKMPAYVTRILREHRKRQIAGDKAQSELIFTAPNGGLLIKSNFLRKSFKPLLEASGCPKIRFHDLRHTAATLAFEEGQHPKQVQEMLGHASVTLTLDTYSAFIPTMQDKLADAMERALFG